MKGTILEEMGHTRNKYVFWIKTCQKLVIFDYFNEESSPTNGSLTKWWSKLTEWWKRLIALGRVKNWNLLLLGWTSHHWSGKNKVIYFWNKTIFEHFLKKVYFHNWKSHEESKTIFKFHKTALGQPNFWLLRCQIWSGYVQLTLLIGGQDMPALFQMVISPWKKGSGGPKFLDFSFSWLKVHSKAQHY